MIKNVKEIILNKWYAFAAFLTVSTMFGPVSAFAAKNNTELAAGISNTSINTITGKVVGVILQVFTYIGILLLCWSIGMLVMAFRNEDADSKSRAMMLLVVSAALIGLKTFLIGVGIVASAA